MAAPSALTIARGASGTATITLTPQNGFTGNATLACNGLPAGVSCSFSPSTVTIGASPATTTLTITNDRTGQSVLRLGLALPALFAAGGLFAARRRQAQDRRLRRDPSASSG